MSVGREGSRYLDSGFRFCLLVSFFGELVEVGSVCLGFSLGMGIGNVLFCDIYFVVGIC